MREPASVDLAARLQLLTARNHAGPPFVSVHVEPDAVPRASEDVRWHLARIAEEAVANACRHASATQIRVELQSLAEGVRLRVHDDGQGFNTAEMDQRGYGLSGMKERTEQLQGGSRLSVLQGRARRSARRCLRDPHRGGGRSTGDSRGARRDPEFAG